MSTTLVTDAALVAEGLEFSYGRHLVVDQVDLVLESGQTLGLVGRNGSGKTTLLRLLAGFLRPRTGAVRLEGKDLQGWERRALATRLAMVSQEPEGEMPFTAAEVVMMGRTPYQGDSNDNPQKAHQAMDAAGIVHLAQRSFLELSGGERQLVLIARALAQDPDYLLLDEPTNHLDIHHQHAVLNLVSSQKQRGTVVVLHDLNLAARYCDQIMVLKDGRTRAFGKPAQVLEPDLVDEVFSIRAKQVWDQGVLQLLFSRG